MSETQQMLPVSAEWNDGIGNRDHSRYNTLIHEFTVIIGEEKEIEAQRERRKEKGIGGREEIRGVG